MRRKDVSGNILFIILMAIVLLAALYYAVTNSMRGGGKDASGDKAALTAADFQNYTSLVQNVVMRMTTSGNCTAAQISYQTPSGTNANSNAPSDKHCHVFRPEGGGVAYRNLGSGYCPNSKTYAELDEGEVCGTLVYLGEYGGARKYAALGELGGTYSYNNGTTNYSVTGANSTTNGFNNTEILIANTGTGAPYAAATACRALGANWYLPAKDELTFMDTKKTYLTGYISWHVLVSSSETSASYLWTFQPSFGLNTGTKEYSNYSVRCMLKG